MEQGREPAGAAYCSFSGCVSLRGEQSGGNVSPKRLIYYRFVVSCSMSYRSPSAPLYRPTPFSSESKRSGCPINLVNLCRMRAKCQQTKSQLAERPHNMTPSGSTTPPPLCPSRTYFYSSYSLAAFQNACCVHIKLSSPNGKLQNAKHKTRMRMRRRGRRQVQIHVQYKVVAFAKSRRRCHCDISRFI